MAFEATGEAAELNKYNRKLSGAAFTWTCLWFREVLRRTCLVLVEHDGLWVLVHHLRHVSEHVLLRDDAQEPPAPGDQTLPQTQFPKDVDHGLHGRVVCDGEGAQVQDAA